MLPIRTPLRSIAGNSKDYKHLSLYQRGLVVGKKSKGATDTEIADDLDLDRSSVRYTIRQELERPNGQDLPRAARKKLYTEREERLLLCFVRLWPKATYKQAINGCGLICKTTIVKKILKKHGITNWRAKKRPELTEENALKRLVWCLAWRGLTAEEWGLILWSDECSVERGRGKRQEWVFRTPADKWKKEMVQTYDTNKNMKVMVWGAFWDIGRTSLYIMDRDFAAKKYGYSANSYLEVLDGELAPVWERLDPGYKFMQDNAPIHRAGKVTEWFREHGIDILKDWLLYSPDLNPIEHIWWHLKVRLYEMFPEEASNKSKTEYARQRLESCLQAAWDTLDDSLFTALIESMPRRIEACIEANGWYTKY
jgi:hypothetical protein